LLSRQPEPPPSAGLVHGRWDMSWVGNGGSGVQTGGHRPSSHSNAAVRTYTRCNRGDGPGGERPVRHRGGQRVRRHARRHGLFLPGRGPVRGPSRPPSQLPRPGPTRKRCGRRTTNRSGSCCPGPPTRWPATSAGALDELAVKDGRRLLAELVLDEAGGRLSQPSQTLPRVQNKARLLRALYGRLDRLQDPAHGPEEATSAP
jgi:hypothetical protein